MICLFWQRAPSTALFDVKMTHRGTCQGRKNKRKNLSTVSANIPAVVRLPPPKIMNETFWIGDG